MSRRVERFSSTLKHCLADIVINQVKNPKLKTTVISNVIVEPNLKKARIFIASPVEDPDETVRRLERAKGFIKRALGKQMYLKFVPELLFIKDDTTDLFEYPGSHERQTNDDPLLTNDP